MPKLNIKKSVVIDAPAEKVFAAVRDFKQWRKWSPWLIAEPDCPMTYAADGSGYSWDGKIIGAGEMEITGEDAPRSIDCKLTFLKPWKSVSAVRFIFTPKGESTEVTWSMDGSLPFFLFFLKNMMTTFVGMDYERGLNMLKDYVETGSVPVNLEFTGTHPFPATTYVGITTECPIPQIGPQMGKDMEKLSSQVTSGVFVPTGKPLSIYHKWAAVEGLVKYTIGFPVASKPSDLPAGFVTGEIPACETYNIKLTGPYRHLGNAWSAGIMHGRAKVFRQSKSIPPFEIYENDPCETPENDLVTLVRMPTK